MNVGDLTARYQAMDDGELLALASEPDQLSAEAQISLTEELARRHINPKDLSDGLREEVKARSELERHWNPDAAYFFWPELRWFVARINNWQEFARRTGRIPTLSILTYFIHLAFSLFVLALVIWYSAQRHWSNWIFIGCVAPLAIADSYALDWLLSKVRIYEIVRYRSRRSAKR
jgi:hypothetical protein